MLKAQRRRVLIIPIPFKLWLFKSRCEYRKQASTCASSERVVERVVGRTGYALPVVCDENLHILITLTCLPPRSTLSFNYAGYRHTRDGDGSETHSSADHPRVRPG